VAARLCERILGLLASGIAPTATRSTWLESLGVWFSALGRPADALPVTEESVAIRRELAAANPDRYLPDLAASLSNLGIWFSELGRPADALPAEQEAVAIRRELAAANPDRYRPDLAASLSNLAEILKKLGSEGEKVVASSDADAPQARTSE
jgi:tetratricopeptide (TPR) repeat protein